MGTIDVICESCGTANPPGVEFCQNCKAFLAWNRGHTATQPIPAQAPAGPAAQDVRGQSAGNPPTRVEAAPPPGQPAWASYCTWCGAGNPTGRHLCRRCGLLLDRADPWSRPAASAASSPAAPTAAAYERAVPGWYRGRAAIVTAAVLGLGLLLWASIPSIPRAADAWDARDRHYLPVPVASVRVENPAAVRGKATPATVVDGSEQELTLAWTAPKGSPSCASPGTTWIVLQLKQPSQIAGLQISAGLSKGNPLADAELRPTMVGVQLDGGPCTSAEVGPDWKQVEAGGANVRTIRVAVLDAKGAADAKPQVSIAEIQPYSLA